MIRYMLDTNACIGIINGDSDIRARLARIDPDQIAISQVVVCELEYGVCRSTRPEKNRAALETFIARVHPVDFGRSQASEAALILSELAATGRPIGHYDVLIAAHARSINAVIVTHNTHEFERVKGLKIEDWEKQMQKKCSLIIRQKSTAN